MASCIHAAPTGEDDPNYSWNRPNCTLDSPNCTWDSPNCTWECPNCTWDAPKCSWDSSETPICFRFSVRMVVGTKDRIAPQGAMLGAQTRKRQTDAQTRVND